MRASLKGNLFDAELGYATPRVLHQQLKELEDHGMVRKVIYPVLPPKVEYFLTPEGESMLPIVDAMKAWGDQYGDVFQARLDALTVVEVSD